MATTISPTAGFDEGLLQQLSNGHSAEQQIWLSGYLYGLATARQQGGTVADVAPVSQAVTAVAGVKTERLTILYGSQTGNSKKVAGKVAASVRDKGWEANIVDLNDYATKNLKEEKIVLLVVSTQGEGDPPTAAEDFHRWLLGARAPKLEGLQFSVCGLGDKSYLKYCQTGKEFDTRFEALGATRLADRADCDAEYEDSVEQWIKGVLENLPAQSAGAARIQPNGTSHVNGLNGASKIAVAKTAERYDRKNPFAAPVLEKIQMNGRGSAKETWHMELSLEGSGLTYEPGDSLGVFPVNAESLVREVLYAAMLNGNKVVTFNEKEGLFRDILLRDVELTVLTREVLEKYAQWTNSAKLKALLLDPAALKNFLWGRNVADLLREYPAALSETTLLTILRRMPPRLYSLASSLDAHPEEAHLTVAAVRYQFDSRAHQGVASTFLADRLDVGQTIPVFIEQNEYFKLPADDAADIIMVGPGTPVAPFRAFVEARSERGASGKNWLFFGNPNFTTDFLYQTEWLQHLKRGTLDRLDVAFSRDQSEKIYVQHRLLERSKLIFERLENGAYFYVCGDKNHMAADVQNAVLQVITKETGKGEEQAAEYLKTLKKQRRYLEDVY